MKRDIARIVLLTASVAILSMSLAPQVSAQLCSATTVAGSWGCAQIPRRRGGERLWLGSQKCGRRFRR
jgi:hypothetical protein